LVSEAFAKNGAQLVAARQNADVSVGIYASFGGRFGFLVSDPSSQKLGRRAECSPQALASAIMTAVCEFLRQSDVGMPELRQDVQRARLLQSLDQATNQDAKEVQKTLGCSLDDLVDALLYSISDLNRKITSGVLASDIEMTASYMTQLTQRITMLGQLGDERGISAILNALGDAAVAYESSGLPHALMLREAAADALVAFGAPAMKPIRENLHDPNLAIRQALEAVYEQLQRKGL
jgi:HEAT repeat protein